MKITCFCILFAFSTSLVAQDKVGLPTDSLDLLAKLQEFEKSERAKVERSIEEKRKIVAEHLREHLNRETKAGHLDVALEIRNAIQLLSNPSVENMESSKEQPTPTQTSPVETLADTEWLRDEEKAKEGESAIVKFYKTGATLQVKWKDGSSGSYPFTTDGRELTFSPGGKPKQKFEFSRDWSSFKWNGATYGRRANTK